MKQVLFALLLVFQLSLSLGVEAMAEEHNSVQAMSDCASMSVTTTQDACASNCNDCITCHCSHQHNNAAPVFSAVKAVWAASTDMVAANAYQQNEHLTTPSPLLEPPAKA